MQRVSSLSEEGKNCFVCRYSKLKQKAAISSQAQVKAVGADPACTDRQPYKWRKERVSWETDEGGGSSGESLHRQSKKEEKEVGGSKSVQHMNWSDNECHTSTTSVSSVEWDESTSSRTELVRFKTYIHHNRVAQATQTRRESGKANDGS
ncbi:hypothetical protein ASPBRDRAFT_34863 [Aspergillus brasiliensis CBS 101740]|uniref:Uncharacterized protein n=1 Tax=Aspergillus brasiliensis (strain CBS 101740 / IMI 381727 / IBT 21946) TaxID=767769 RepID=A0A1L9U501_ASPBC|nr:hypothetical protein ASPBRDRAFT_34863 [Aspergillus brasiliensis CBS 101740]